jgi:DNA end-binding protein Ku
MAVTIIESMSATFDPQAFQPTQRDAMREMVEAKLAGSGWSAPKPQEIAEVIDIQSALKATIATTKKRERRAA